MPMDVAERLQAVERQVRTVDRDGTPARQVVATRTFDTDPEDLWDALTSAERIPRWFLPVSGELRLGGRYQLEGNAGGVIEECEPPRRLAITWGMGDDESWVVLRLDPVDDGRTVLVLEHTALVPEEFWTTYGPGAVGVGWDLALMGLVEHVSGRDDAVTPETSQVWLASPEAAAYIRGSNDGWAQASIASGTEPDAAATAAAATLAFYTAPPGT